MTKPKYNNPRSRLRSAKKDSVSIETTVPERIAGYWSLKAGQSVEWITIEKGDERWVELRRILNQGQIL